MLLWFAVLALAGLSLGARAAHADPAVRYWCTEGAVTTDCGAWHTTSVSLHWAVTDATDAPNCPAAVTLSREAEHRWTCTATEVVPGRTSTVRLTAVVRIDKTAPVTTGADAERPPRPEGWYRTPVGVTFRGQDETSGIAECTASTYAGPDAGTVTMTGTCRDAAGLVSAPATFELRYDATPPDVTAAVPDRQADHGGWFNRPVGFLVQGFDATSGLLTCDPASYDGQPGQAPAVTGTCRDRAGNDASRSFPLRYDAAPPTIAVRALPGDRVVKVRWATSEDTSRVEVRRAPGLRGAPESIVYVGLAGAFLDRRVANRKRYRYAVVALDEAGNRAPRAVVAIPGARLLWPLDQARRTAPPVLRWTPVQGTRYYNVQLFRDGQRILSAWPVKASLLLGRHWGFRGRAIDLTTGRYRWYVWPGVGPRRQATFGTLIGRRTFVIERPGVAPNGLARSRPVLP